MNAIRSMTPSLPTIKLASAQRTTNVVFGSHHHKSQGTLSVTGQHVVYKQPDVMQLNLVVNETADTKAAVNKALNERGNKLMTNLKALGLTAEMQSRVNVSEKYVYNRQTGENEKRGFQGSFQVTIVQRNGNPEDFAKNAAQIKEVSESLDTDFHGPNYSLSPKRRTAAAREALNGAYKDALKQAQQLGKAGGFTVNATPQAVDIGGASNQVAPRAHRAGLEMAAMSADAPGGGAPSASMFEAVDIPVSSPALAIRYAISSNDDGHGASGCCGGKGHDHGGKVDTQA